MKAKTIFIIWVYLVISSVVYPQNRGKKISSKALNRIQSVENKSQVKTNSQTLIIPKVKTFTVKGVSFDMIEVKGGKFTMGYHGVAQGPTYNKYKPAHEVILSDFWIGKLEVTQELWEAVMGNNPSSKINGKKPVNQVSYNDCEVFIKKLSELTGVSFSLPTEAQWEYAALGGIKRHDYTYSGGEKLDDVAVHSGNSSGAMRCGMMQPNELGIYDMSGNVFEFTIDRSHIWGNQTLTDPIFDKLAMPYAVIKGGSYSSTDWPCRVYYRAMAQITDGGSPEIGFRLVIK